MASLNKTKSLRKTLSKFGVSEKAITRLENEEFDLDILKNMNNRNYINSGLSNFSPREIRKIKNWQKSLSKKVTPRRSTSKNRNSNSSSKKGQAEDLSPLPNTAPVFSRQNTVSEILLTELVTNAKLRTLMDRLMNDSWQEFKYLEQVDRESIKHSVTLYDHKENGFKSNLKADHQSIYYRWNKEGTNEEAFHLSLNHTDNEKHSNRSGFHRDKNGALHIRLNDGHNNDGEGSGRGTLCRLLINYANGEYVITVCLPKTRHKFVDPISRHISNILVDYYKITERNARISEHSGKGKGKGKGTQNSICK
jgi:hypothetical protein